jgi:hypothetical protein
MGKLVYWAIGDDPTDPDGIARELQTDSGATYDLEYLAKDGSWVSDLELGRSIFFGAIDFEKIPVGDEADLIKKVLAKANDAGRDANDPGVV